MSKKRQTSAQAMAAAALQPLPGPNALSDRRVWLLSAMLVAATLAVYLQAARFNFVMVDDPVYVGDNEHVRQGLSVGNLGWAFTTFHDGNWFPLTWISLMLDASIYGLWPGGYHLTNVLLHTANVLLVFATFTRMTRQMLPSAAVAALFAVHPLHVQSVAWIAERKDVLSMLFGLGSLYAYIAYAQTGKPWRLVLSVLFFLCSLCSKQTFVTLPCVFLLLDVWPMRRWSFAGNNSLSAAVNASDRQQTGIPKHPPESPRARGMPALVIEKLPFFVLSAAFCVLATIAQTRGGAVLSFTVIPLGTRILNALVVYRLYIQKAFLPFGLVAFYPHPGSRLGLGDVAISAVFLLCVTVLAVVQMRRRPYLLVGWLWYVGTLVPMIGLVQLSGQQMADRYTYFPLLGCYLAVVWFAASLAVPLNLPKFALPAVTAAVVVAYGSVAVVQASHWRDSVSLFQHAVAVGEKNPYSLTTLGWALVNEKRFDEALPPLRQAVELTPDFGQAQFLLACVLQRDSKFDEAAAHFRAALASDDNNAAAHLNLGTILMARREYPAAKREFDRVVELDPGNARVQASLAELYLRLRQFNETITHARRGLELDPSQTQCRRLIVIALRSQGRLDEAIEQVRQLLAVAPDDRASQQELQRLLAQRSGNAHAKNR
jgi:Flp pilus assembly protein TadD